MNKQSQGHREQTGICQGSSGGRGLYWEFGIFLLQTGAYRLDRQQGPIVQHKELHSVSYDKP